MDLGALDTRAASNNGAKIELKHPVTKAGLGNYIHCVGKDSDAFRKWSAAKINGDRMRDFEAQRKKNGVALPQTVEQDEAKAIDLFIACTTGFSCDPVMSKNGIDVIEEGGDFLRLPGGVRVTYTEENAAKIFRDYPEVFRQVNEGIGDLENFMKG